MTPRRRSPATTSSASFRALQDGVEGRSTTARSTIITAGRRRRRGPRRRADLPARPAQRQARRRRSSRSGGSEPRWPRRARLRSSRRRPGSTRCVVPAEPDGDRGRRSAIAARLVELAARSRRWPCRRTPEVVATDRAAHRDSRDHRDDRPPSRQQRKAAREAWRRAPTVATGQNGRLMKVLLRNPRREVEIDGPPPRRTRCSTELGLDRESHLVIRNGTLVPGDERLDDADDVEIRPVISGGCDA